MKKIITFIVLLISITACVPILPLDGYGGYGYGNYNLGSFGNTTVEKDKTSTTKTNSNTTIDSFTTSSSFGDMDRVSSNINRETIETTNTKSVERTKTKSSGFNISADDFIKNFMQGY